MSRLGSAFSLAAALALLVVAPAAAQEEAAPSCSDSTPAQAIETAQQRHAAGHLEGSLRCLEEARERRASPLLTEAIEGLRGQMVRVVARGGRGYLLGAGERTYVLPVDRPIYIAPGPIRVRVRERVRFGAPGVIVRLVERVAQPGEEVELLLPGYHPPGRARRIGSASAFPQEEDIRGIRLRLREDPQSVSPAEQELLQSWRVGPTGTGPALALILPGVGLMVVGGLVALGSLFSSGGSDEGDRLRAVSGGIAALGLGLFIGGLILNAALENDRGEYEEQLRRRWRRGDFEGIRSRRP